MHNTSDYKAYINDYKLPKGDLVITINRPIDGAELPHRVLVEVGDKKIQAAGVKLSDALRRGLHMAGFPRVSKKELARILFWRYGPPYTWTWKEAIGALDKDR